MKGLEEKTHMASLHRAGVVYYVLKTTHQWKFIEKDTLCTPAFMARFHAPTSFFMQKLF